MKRTLPVALAFILSAGISVSSFAANDGAIDQTNKLEGYKLIFSDEFDYEGKPDPTKWTFEKGLVRNCEPQVYQEENAYVKNGFLTITARKETKPYPKGGYDGCKARTSPVTFTHYTSSSIITQGKFDFKYGRAEMLAKIDTSQGQWPAFWMKGSNQPEVGWPASGEVDIMEFYRKNLLANFFWEKPDGSVIVNDSLHNINKFGGEEFQNDFHIWALDWDEDYMRVYMDDHLLNEIKITDIRNGKLGNNPFQEKFFLIVNLALGQSNEKIPDETMPSEFIVDYVRVYQKEE